MKTFMKSFVSIVLVLAMLLVTTSCAINGVVDNIGRDEKNENNRYYDIMEGENLPQKEGLLTEANVDKSYFDVPSDNDGFYVDGDTILDEDMVEFLSCIEIDKRESVFEVALQSLAFDLYEGGFDVFKGLALVDGEYVPGLAYTKYQVYSEEDDMTVYSCGFLQISEKNVDSHVAITNEDVQQGIIVVPLGEYDANVSFLLNMGVSLNSYSGIFDGFYFKHEQTSDYSVEIYVKENSRDIWDEDVTLYDFDNSKYIFKGDMTYSGTNATPYFSDEAKAYQAARQAVDQIIAYQEENSYNSQLSTVIVFSADVIEEYMLGRQNGTINGFLLSEIQSLEGTLEPNQVLLVTTEGVSIQTIVDTDELARERLTNGLIGFFGSALMLAGSIFVACVTFGAGMPLVVGAVMAVTTTGAVLYSLSNAFASAQDIVYGLMGDVTSDTYNPLLSAFQAMVPDPHKAEILYHTVGISCSILQALCVPANAAISLSKAAGVTSSWKIGLAVTRAVAVEFAKMSVTAVVSAGIGYGTNKLTVAITGSENIGKLVGFGSALVSGWFTYKGLQRLDSKYNFSGLQNKKAVVDSYKKQTQPDSNDELRWDLVNKKGQTRMDYICEKHGPNAPVNPAKPEQTFFNDDPAGIINKAWGMKGNGDCRIEGATTVYEIKIQYTIGTKGESVVRIIIMTETNQLVNAYPIVLP